MADASTGKQKTPTPFHMLNGDYRTLVYTDLDGTLLDHHNYSHDGALPALNALQEQRIPLIFNTSKTAAEVVGLRRSIGNRDPFIVENGSAVWLPEHYFQIEKGDFSEATLDGERYLIKRWGSDREYCLAAAAQVAGELGIKSGQDFKTFTALGDQGIADCTGLSLEQATLANQRVASEPLLWLGSQADRNALLDKLDQQAVNVLIGGRFIHILGPGCSKGSAMRWLTSQYRLHSSEKNYRTIALGDSPNDLDMLEEADVAIAIKPADGEHLDLSHLKNWRASKLPAPSGWSECLLSLLEKS